MRTLFGHPIRAETTATFFPDAMTLADFIEDMQANVAAYGREMAGPHGGEWVKQPHFIEEWTESLLAWSEIEDEWPRAARPTPAETKTP